MIFVPCYALCLLRENLLLEYPAEAQKIIAKNLLSDANAAAEIKTLEWLDYAQNMKFFNGSPSEAQKLLQETADLWLRLEIDQTQN